MENFDFDVIQDDDELDVLELVIVGIPRRINVRKNYFDTYDDLSFYQRFRLSKNTAYEVLLQIEDQLEYEHNRNNSVSPMQQLLVCLRLYATNGYMVTMADYGGMHKSTMSRILVEVSRAITSSAQQYIKMPMTQEEIRKTQNRFFNIASFPRVIGAIDSTHVKVQSPGGEDAEIFRNRKSYFSLNVQVTVNGNKEIIDIVSRWPGSVHDSTIFNNSNLRAKFKRREFPNCILLDDSGYPSRTYLFTPHLDPRTASQQLYNESHMRTRVVVEHVFGMWKRRFSILAYGSHIKIETLLIVIVATAVLHNIAQRKGEDVPPLFNNEEHVLQNLIAAGQIPNIPCVENERRNIGLVMRNTLIEEYFGNLIY